MMMHVVALSSWNARFDDEYVPELDGWHDYGTYITLARFRAELLRRVYLMEKGLLDDDEEARHQGDRQAQSTHEAPRAAAASGRDDDPHEDC